MVGIEAVSTVLQAYRQAPSMLGVSSMLERGHHWGFHELFVHCPYCFPHPSPRELPASILTATATFTFRIPRRHTPSTHMTYIFVSHDRGPLTFSCPTYIALLSCLRFDHTSISFCIYKYKSTVQSLEYYFQGCTATTMICKLLRVNKCRQNAERTKGGIDV